MGDLVGDDGGKTGLVLGDRQDARVDSDLPGRQRKGVRLVGLEQHELPLGVWDAHDVGDAPPDRLELRVGRAVAGDGLLSLDLLKGLKTDLGLLSGIDHQDLAPAGLRRSRAAAQHEQHAEDCERPSETEAAGLGDAEGTARLRTRSDGRAGCALGRAEKRRVRCVYHAGKMGANRAAHQPFVCSSSDRCRLVQVSGMMPCARSPGRRSSSDRASRRHRRDAPCSSG
jgi:hypothetical protein